MTATVLTLPPFVIRFIRPRIEAAHDCQGCYVILPNGHAWLHGDRRAALKDFHQIENIERSGRP